MGKGRRLKRYLGLRRSQGIVFQGGIDRLLPGKLMGWVMAADPQASFYEVRLLVGPHLIARAEINQPRPDVCEQLGKQGNPGFVLPVPVELPPLDWTLPVRVVAVSADGSAQAELPLMPKKAKTAERLRALLQSDCLGMDGHVDGVQGENWLAGPVVLRISLQPFGYKPRALSRSELLAEIGAKVWPTNRCLISAAFQLRLILFRIAGLIKIFG